MDGAMAVSYTHLQGVDAVIDSPYGPGRFADAVQTGETENAAAGNSAGIVLGRGFRGPVRAILISNPVSYTHLLPPGRAQRRYPERWRCVPGT